MAREGPSIRSGWDSRHLNRPAEKGGRPPRRRSGEPVPSRAAQNAGTPSLGISRPGPAVSLGSHCPDGLATWGCFNSKERRIKGKTQPHEPTGSRGPIAALLARCF